MPVFLLSLERSTSCFGRVTGKKDEAEGDFLGGSCTDCRHRISCACTFPWYRLKNVFTSVFLRASRILSHGYFRRDAGDPANLMNEIWTCGSFRFNDTRLTQLHRHLARFFPSIFFSVLAERKGRAKARKDVLDETGNEKGGGGCFTENWNSQHGQTVIFAIVRDSIALLARCMSFPRSANIPIVSFRLIYRENKSSRFLNVKSFLYLWVLREFCTFLRLLISRKSVVAKSFNVAQNWSQISAVQRGNCKLVSLDAKI